MQINNFLTYLALNTNYPLTPDGEFNALLCIERNGVKFFIDMRPNSEEAYSIRLSAQTVDREIYYAYYDFGYPNGPYTENIKSSKEFQEIVQHCQTWLKELE